MRKLLQVLGILTVVALGASGIGLGVIAYEGHALDAESKAFVDNEVPAIATTWSKEELLDRATPELRSNIAPDQLTSIFNTLSKLGPLIKYEGATGQSTMSYFTGSDSRASASYVANAKFQNGTATFRIALVKRGGQWMIYNFHVDPVKSVNLL